MSKTTVDNFPVLDTRLSKVESKLDRAIDEFGSIKEDITIIKEFLATEVMTKQDKNEILSYMDAFIKRTIKVEDEQTMQAYRIRENTDTLERHDKEIKELRITIA